MRMLALMRHGKSSWNDAALADRDRPLNQRGERDVPMIAEKLKELGVRPSLILASPAKRAWSTALLSADTMGYPREFMHRDEELYLADAVTLRRVLGAQDDNFMSMLICCHNPGITDFANELAPDITANLPTSGCVVLQTKCDSWLQFPDAKLDLVAFEYPKKYSS